MVLELYFLTVSFIFLIPFVQHTVNFYNFQKSFSLQVLEFLNSNILLFRLKLLLFFAAVVDKPIGNLQEH